MSEMLSQTIAKGGGEYSNDGLRIRQNCKGMNS